MVRPPFILGVMAMAAVAVMHEDMHQWTGKQEQEGQEAQHMESVFIDKERRDDQAEDHENCLAD
jgi:hypothetical protein